MYLTNMKLYCSLSPPYFGSNRRCRHDRQSRRLADNEGSGSPFPQCMDMCPRPDYLSERLSLPEPVAAIALKIEIMFRNSSLTSLLPISSACIRFVRLELPERSDCSDVLPSLSPSYSVCLIAVRNDRCISKYSYAKCEAWIFHLAGQGLCPYALSVLDEYPVPLFLLP